MSPNDADGMANSVDPDQTAPLVAVWSGSALFAQACLSENLGSLQYFQNSRSFVLTKIQKIWTPFKLAVIILKLEQSRFITDVLAQKMQTE